MGFPPNSLRRARPSALIPDPASMTIISEPILNSQQLVLPPYRTVDGPGVGIEPRTPQKRSQAVGWDWGSGLSFMSMKNATLPKIHASLSLKKDIYGKVIGSMSEEDFAEELT